MAAESGIRAAEINATGTPAGIAPVLEVKDLSKRYGKKEAVRNLSFTVSGPGVTGLLGENGAGKSTCLRMIAGTLAPTSGSVKVCGFDVAVSPREAKARTGWLPETPPLHGDLTVDENLAFALELKSPSADATSSPSGLTRGANDLIKLLELENVRGVLVRNLSKGYRQRAGIAATLASNPPLVLLDEPASGLDPRQARDLRSLLKTTARNSAVFISSHSLYDIASLCDRVIIMKAGAVIADLTTADLLADADLTAEGLEDIFIKLTEDAR